MKVLFIGLAVVGTFLIGCWLHLTLLAIAIAMAVTTALGAWKL